MIIARKSIERKAPTVATGMEVYRTTGLTVNEQLAEAEAFGDTVIIGRTMTDVYYKIKEE